MENFEQHEKNINDKLIDYAKMGPELKELVAKFAGGDTNDKIANYLDTRDSKPNNGVISKDTWNNYRDAVYGTLKKSATFHFGEVKNTINKNDASYSLDKYDQEWKENFN